MKKSIFFLLYAVSVMNAFSQNVGFGTNTPHVSSALDIQDNNRGILIPRMSAASRLAISNPAKGLLVFQNDLDSGFWFYSGSQWKKQLDESALSVVWGLSGNVTGLNDFIGTINNSALKFKVNTFNAGIIDWFTGNTGLGPQSFNSNTTGLNNAFLGKSSLFKNTTGDLNTAIGSNALFQNISGSYNSALGALALNNNTEGYYNTACGAEALFYNYTGIENTAIGRRALYSNVTGNNNTASGRVALYYNTGGNDNTAGGAGALYSNTTGSSNTALGVYSLFSNTIGYDNTAVGLNALNLNTTGFDNTASGYFALVNNTTGSSNTANGTKALQATTTGGLNTAFGVLSLKENTSGIGNTGSGYSSLGSNATGSYNTAVGYIADVTVGNISNSTAIGFLANVDASNKIRIGNSSVISNGGQVNWTAFSDARIKNNVRENVPGLAFIKNLRPVTYHFDISRQNQLIGAEDTLNWQGKYDIEKIQFSGFIAQDVDNAAKSIGYDFSGVDKSGKLLGLRYSEFVVPLVKAVQEQQHIIEEQNKTIEKQDSKIAALQEKVDAILQSQSRNGSVAISMDNSRNTTLLGQNIPNPVENNTIIPFRIPSDCRDASIVISQAGTGRVVKVIPVSCKETQVSIDAGSLAAGSYNYSLYVNGKSVDMKKMVLAK